MFPNQEEHNKGSLDLPYFLRDAAYSTGAGQALPSSDSGTRDSLIHPSSI